MYCALSFRTKFLVLAGPGIAVTDGFQLKPPWHPGGQESSESPLGLQCWAFLFVIIVPLLSYDEPNAALIQIPCFVQLSLTANTWQVLEQEVLLRLHGIYMNEECLGVEGELAKVKIHLEVGCESFSIDHTAIRVDLCHTILTTAFTLLVAKRYCC